MLVKKKVYKDNCFLFRAAAVPRALAKMLRLGQDLSAAYSPQGLPWESGEGRLVCLDL